MATLCDRFLATVANQAVPDKESDEAMFRYEVASECIALSTDGVYLFLPPADMLDTRFRIRLGEIFKGNARMRKKKVWLLNNWKSGGFPDMELSERFAAFPWDIRESWTQECACKLRDCHGLTLQSQVRTKREAPRVVTRIEFGNFFSNVPLLSKRDILRSIPEAVSNNLATKAVAPAVKKMAFKLPDVATALSISQITVRRLINQGALKANRATRHLLVSREEISRFLAQ